MTQNKLICDMWKLFRSLVCWWCKKTAQNIQWKRWCKMRLQTDIWDKNRFSSPPAWACACSRCRCRRGQRAWGDGAIWATRSPPPLSPATGQPTSSPSLAACRSYSSRHPKNGHWDEGSLRGPYSLSGDLCRLKNTQVVCNAVNGGQRWFFAPTKSAVWKNRKKW